MPDLIHGFVPTYEGQDVKSLKFQATYPACQASITIRSSNAGEFVIQVAHAWP